MDHMETKIADMVLKELHTQTRLTLERAKCLMNEAEQESRRRGLNSVVAVCGPDGNMISVDAMEDAFLISFQVAMQKAYTSVAVRLSIMEFGRLAQPGQTFYGADKAENGRVTIIAGGVPLMAQGKLVGGLGVSGGTGEEDHSLAEYGASLLDKILG